MTTAGSDPQAALAQRVRTALSAQRSVREVSMFGGLSFMVDERMAVAAGRDGSLLVRADSARYDELLARGAEPAVMGADRPMGRGWLTVPPRELEDDETLAQWITIGIDSRDAGK